MRATVVVVVAPIVSSSHTQPRPLNAPPPPKLAPVDFSRYSGVSFAQSDPVFFVNTFVCFAVVKVLVTTWLDEVTHMGNAHADSLLVHFYR